MRKGRSSNINFAMTLAVGYNLILAQVATLFMLYYAEGEKKQYKFCDDPCREVQSYFSVDYHIIYDALHEE